jgi:hypothetical protein
VPPWPPSRKFPTKMPSLAISILDELESREAALPVDVPETVPDDADFQRMLSRRRKEFAAITRKLADGDIDPIEWANLFEASILEGHTHAAHMGRMLALQEVVEAELVDLLRGQAAADAEHFYVQGFFQALLDKDPRYWDEEAEKWNQLAIRQRQDFYLGKMRGTANQAFIEESGDDSEITWHLGGTEDHCTECPEYAGMSPFLKDELPTWPGDNDTPCRFNCLCYISIDKVDGFKSVRF